MFRYDSNMRLAGNNVLLPALELYSSINVVKIRVLHVLIQ
jgi:hypothetical protein